MGVRQKLPLIRSKRRIVRWFGYVVYIFVALIVLGIVFGGEEKPHRSAELFTCPADKYLLQGSDFKETGWTIGQASDEIPSGIKDIVGNYECYKKGALKKDMDIFHYVIFIYNNKTAAESEYGRIKESYTSKYSIEELWLGDGGFKVKRGTMSILGHEGYVLWVLDKNSLIYVTCLVI